MKASMRRSLGLESVAVTFASSDEPSEVVGIDVAELFGEVDAHDHHAPNTEDGNGSSIEIVCEDMETIQTIADVLKSAGDDGATPVALALAQESMQAIFTRYGVKPRAFAKEAIEKGQAHATKEALAYAAEGMAQMAKEGIGESIVNTINRLRANTQQFFRRRTTWRKEALKLQQALRSASGTPNDKATYSNKIRIAHMTTGSKDVLTDGNEMLKAVNVVHSSLNGAVPFLTALTSIFSWFNSEKGKADFNKIAANFKPSQHSDELLSISGPIALFGEETVMTKFGGVSENIEEMMKIMGSITIQHRHYWKVKDLESTPLKPLSIDEMNKSIDALVKAADEIYNIYVRNDEEMGVFYEEQRRKYSGGIDPDMIVSPVVFFRFQHIYLSILNHMLFAVKQALDLNFMAATSMLDYYMWSLKNNK